MKKIIGFALAALLVLNGCSASGGSASDRTGSGSTQTAASSENSEKGIDVDKKLFSVEVTIPKSLLGDEEITQEKLDAELSDGVKSATLNEDGSVTYVMTHDKHQELLKAAGDSLRQTLSEIVTSGDYPSITGAEASDDFKVFTLTTTANSKEEMGLSGFAALGCLMAGAYYNALDAKDYTDLVVNFVNADGTVIDTYSMQDLLNSPAMNSTN